MAAELSPTMRQALAVIERQPGIRAEHCPGGVRTVEALMNRGRVEVTGRDGFDWRVYLPEHEHRFRNTLHADSCHAFSNAGQCECGVTYSSVNERSLKADPYSAIWMDDFGGTCQRCEELRNGARPRASIVIHRPEREPVS